MTKPEKVPEHGDNVGVKEYAERIIRLSEEKAAITQDVKEIYTEAKAKGANVKALREAIRIHQKERDEEHMITVNMYLKKMGGKEIFA